MLAGRKHRLTGKSVDACLEAPRNWNTAWREYIRAHVVSEHAARLIRNFMATYLPSSAEEDEEETTPNKREESVNECMNWLDLDAMQERMLQESGEVEDGTSDKKRRTPFTAVKQRVASANATILKLWGKSLDGSNETVYTCSESLRYVEKQAKAGKPRASDITRTPVAHVSSKRTLFRRRMDWFLELEGGKMRHAPTHEQLNFLRSIADRCMREESEASLLRRCFFIKSFNLFAKGGKAWGEGLRQS